MKLQQMTKKDCQQMMYDSVHSNKNVYYRGESFSSAEGRIVAFHFSKKGNKASVIQGSGFYGVTRMPFGMLQNCEIYLQ